MLMACLLVIGKIKRRLQEPAVMASREAVYDLDQGVCFGSEKTGENLLNSSRRRYTYQLVLPSYCSKYCTLA